MARRKTHAEFVAEVEALVGDEYTVLGEYINSGTKVLIKHNRCGNKYDTVPSTFLSGRRCRKCNKGAAAAKTTDTFKLEVKKLTGNDYSVLTNYENSYTKLKMKHNICGTVYYVRPHCFLSGVRCPNCHGNIARNKTTNDFKQDVFNVVGDEYTVSEEYKNCRTKILITHNVCGHSYKVIPSSFLHGNRCPRCIESRGERCVAEYLSRNNVNFEREYKFEDCRSLRSLPFDFAVITNNNVACLVEYDGEQHYRTIELFGGEEGLLYRKHNDAIKTQYCADNGIPLIRIPYWEFDNIDEILAKELRKLGVIPKAMPA